MFKRTDQNIDTKKIGKILIIFTLHPMDKAEHKILEQIRAGEIKLFECKALGNNMVESESVEVLSSRTEIPGALTIFIAKFNSSELAKFGRSSLMSDQNTEISKG